MPGRLKIAWSRFKGFVRAEWQLWVALAVIPTAVPLALPLAQTLEEQAVVVGVILQLLGLVTVALGLRESRKLFEQPSLWARFASIFRKPKHHTLRAGAGGLTMPGLQASMKVAPSREPTVEERVSALEDGLNELKEGISQEKQEQGRAGQGTSEERLGRAAGAQGSGRKAT